MLGVKACVLLVCLLLALLLGSCSAQPLPVALRFAFAIPDLASAATVMNGTTPVNNGIGYYSPDITPYENYTSEANTNFNLVVGGKSIGSWPAASYGANTTYTLVAAGSSQSHDIHFLTLADDFNFATDGFARVRFLHLLPSVPDISVVFNNTTFKTLPYLGSSGYVDLPTKQWMFDFYAGSNLILTEPLFLNDQTVARSCCACLAHLLPRRCTPSGSRKLLARHR
jgi:hypothetical protein